MRVVDNRGEKNGKKENRRDEDLFLKIKFIKEGRIDMVHKIRENTKYGRYVIKQRRKTRRNARCRSKTKIETR